MKIKGTVVRQDIEGGFWGIQGDDGQNYLPVEGLPASAQIEGCRIEAEAEPANVMTFAQWGRAVRLRHLKTR